MEARKPNIQAGGVQNMAMKVKINVLLIEENRLLREGIASMLNAHGDFEVVARPEERSPTRQLVGLASSPDVILLDLGLTRKDNRKLMSSIQVEHPDAKIVAMDILPEQVDIVEFVKAGGCGFILKDATLNDYIATIKSVAKGEKVLPSVLTKSLFTQIIENALKTGGIPDSLIRLTSRERDIVALISEGLSNKEIGQRLHIATYTVKSHVHNILEKLALTTRLQIAAFVRRENQ